MTAAKRLSCQPQNTYKIFIPTMSPHQRHRITCLCLVFVVCIKYVESQATCDGLVGSTNKCACTYKDGSTGTRKQFDFTPLGKSNGGPAFPYKEISGDYKYAYNPCFAFSDQYCENTAACQLSKNEQYHFPVGDPTKVSYSVENSDIVLKYEANDGRVAIVNFQCDENALDSATYTPLGEQTEGYKFTVGTCLACLTDVPNCHGSSGGGGGGGLTPGGVVCIIFTVLLVVYIVGGILFQKFGRGATGKEMVPNYGFWSDFPLLVKDGFMFLVGLCRGGSGGSDYESIK